MSRSVLKKARKLLARKSAEGLATIPHDWLEFAPLCRIRSGAKIVNFQPYPYQERLYKTIKAHQTTVVAKSRQLGITETISNIFLHKALLNEAYTAVVFSKNQSDTSNVAKRLRRSIDGVAHLGVCLETDSLTDLKIVGGGRLLFRNASPHGARGLESISDILFDECAFVPEIEEIVKSSIPCTSMVGEEARICFVSTPNGQSGFFWDKLSQNNGEKDFLSICEDIREQRIDPTQVWTDTNGLGKVIIHWRDHPIYGADPNYLEGLQKRFSLPLSVVKQEYDLSFLDSEESVFNASIVRACACGAWKKERPLNGEIYIGIDTATVGSDYFVVSILHWDGKKLALVALYRARGKTTESHIYEVGRLIEYWKPEAVGVETNGAGIIVLEQLTTIHKDVYFEKILTTQTSKSGMIGRLVLAMESSSLVIPDDNRVTGELLAFRRDGNKMEASSGSHDDIVMSLAFAVAVSPYRPQPQFFNQETIDKLRSKTNA